MLVRSLEEFQGLYFHAPLTCLLSFRYQSAKSLSLLARSSNNDLDVHYSSETAAVSSAVAVYSKER